MALEAAHALALAQEQHQEETELLQAQLASLQLAAAVAEGARRGGDATSQPARAAADLRRPPPLQLAPDT